MTIKFNSLEFNVTDEKIFMSTCGSFQSKNQGSFVEVQIAGENKLISAGSKMACSSEGENFNYISHALQDNTLEIVLAIKGSAKNDKNSPFYPFR